MIDIKRNYISLHGLGVLTMTVVAVATEVVVHPVSPSSALALIVVVMASAAWPWGWMFPRIWKQRLPPARATESAIPIGLGIALAVPAGAAAAATNETVSAIAVSLAVVGLVHFAARLWGRASGIVAKHSILIGLACGALGIAGSLIDDADVARATTNLLLYGIYGFSLTTASALWARPDGSDAR